MASLELDMNTIIEEICKVKFSRCSIVQPRDNLDAHIFSSKHVESILVYGDRLNADHE
jgi:hypothetical protein